MCKDGSSDRQRTQVPVEVPGFSVRPTNCLKRSGIETVEQLISQTSDELMALPNFGQTSLDEIVERLGDHDLELARLVDRWRRYAGNEEECLLRSLLVMDEG